MRSKSVQHNKPSKSVVVPLLAKPLVADVQLQSAHVVEVINKILDSKNNTLEVHLQHCEPLQEYLQKHQKLDPSTACQLINDMIQGLLYLESKKIFFEVTAEQFGVTENRLVICPTNVMLLVTSDPDYCESASGLRETSFDFPKVLQVLGAILQKSGTADFTHQSQTCFKQMYLKKTWDTGFLSSVSFNLKSLSTSTNNEILKVKVDARSINRNPRDISPSDKNKQLLFKEPPRDDTEDLRKIRQVHKLTKKIEPDQKPMLPLKASEKITKPVARLAKQTERETAPKPSQMRVSKSPLQIRGFNRSYSNYKHFCLIYQFSLEVLASLERIILQEKAGKSRLSQIYAHSSAVIYHNVFFLNRLLTSKSNIINGDDWDEFINDPKKVNRTKMEFNKLLDKIKDESQYFVENLERLFQNNRPISKSVVNTCLRAISDRECVSTYLLESIYPTLKQYLFEFEGQAINQHQSLICKSLQLVLDSEKYLPMVSSTQFETKASICHSDDGLFDWNKFKKYMHDLSWINSIFEQASKAKSLSK